MEDAARTRRKTNRLPARSATVAGILFAVAIILIARVYSADNHPPAEQTHWSFQKLVRPTVPAVAHTELVRTPVDHFIEHKLEAQSLTLSPQADRETLYRRLCFDLTGLPPSPEETTAFVADDSAHAWAQAIDKQLASPHYGERWGKFWLDVAGYADSNGYFNADSDRPLAYKYRDYVVRAFNYDKPFDRFVMEQLAGDELSGYVAGQQVTDEMVELLTATHFLRNAQDGTSESDGNPDEVRADRAAVLEGAQQITVNSLLGLTIQCAKCHEHKFEPIAHEEFYRLQAIFYPAFPAFHEQQWVKPRSRVQNVATESELANWETETKQLDAQAAALKQEFSNWMRATIPSSALKFRDDFDGDGAKVTTKWANRAPGDDTPAGSPEIQLDSSSAPGAFIRDGALCIIESGSPGDRWLCTRDKFDWTPAHEGEWIEATFELKADRVDPAGTPSMRVGYFISSHDFDDSSPVAGGNILLDGNPDGGAAVHYDYPGGDSKPIGDIGVTGYKPGRMHGVRVTNIGENKYRLEQIVDGMPEGKTVDLAGSDLPDGAFAFEYCCGRSFVVDNVQVTQLAGSSPNAEPALKQFAEEYTKRRQALAESLKQVDAQRREKPGSLAFVTDLFAEAPEVHRLERGSYADPAEIVQPAALAALSGPGETMHVEPPFPGAKSTGRRLAFARWLTRPGSHASSLLARVFVNRVWQHHFGIGLVATPDNFGVSGSKPSHPELLNYLAGEFIRSGWSIKSLHRLILQSAVYQQSSALRDDAFAADPDNRLLWRFQTQRLDSETIRDAMLSLAGRLDGRLYGPYVPTQRQEDGGVTVAEDAAGAHRRGLYLQQRRTQVNTMLALFDSPVIVTNCPVRGTSTIPLQSLAMLNSQFVRARAGEFAERLARGAGNDNKQRIDFAFRLATGRQPDDAELAAADRFLNEQTMLHTTQLANAEKAAEKKASQQGLGEQHLTTAAASRAWHDLCQMLFAANAFLYVD